MDNLLNFSPKSVPSHSHLHSFAFVKQWIPKAFSIWISEISSRGGTFSLLHDPQELQGLRDQTLCLLRISFQSLTGQSGEIRDSYIHLHPLPEKRSPLWYRYSKALPVEGWPSVFSPLSESISCWGRPFSLEPVQSRDGTPSV